MFQTNQKLFDIFWIQQSNCFALAVFPITTHKTNNQPVGNISRHHQPQRLQQRQHPCYQNTQQIQTAIIVLQPKRTLSNYRVTIIVIQVDFVSNYSVTTKMTLRLRGSPVGLQTQPVQTSSIRGWSINSLSVNHLVNHHCQLHINYPSKRMKTGLFSWAHHSLRLRHERVSIA